MFLPVFNRDVTNESMAQKHERIFREYGIRIWEKEVDFSKPSWREDLEEARRQSLRVEINGKQLKGLLGRSCTIYLIDNTFLIVMDSTPFRNIHAFDLEGNWIWDIEPCNDQKNMPLESFSQVCNMVVGPNGKKLLTLASNPEEFRTDLETGKGTILWKVHDDTNDR